MGRHFICYSWLDGKDFALKLYHALQDGAPSFHAWLDEFDMPHGYSLQRELLRVIGDCDSLLFVWSRESVDSGYCERELDLADTYGLPVIPLEDIHEAGWRR